MSIEIIGWAASAILVLTIAQQVWKQWQDGRTEGVSSWLFVGQLAASVGFTIYSVLVGNWVFVVTNGLMLVNALLGIAIFHRNRRRTRRRGAGSGGVPTTRSGLPAAAQGRA